MSGEIAVVADYQHLPGIADFDCWIAQTAAAEFAGTAVESSALVDFARTVQGSSTYSNFGDTVPLTVGLPAGQFADSTVELYCCQQLAADTGEAAAGDYQAAAVVDAAVVAAVPVPAAADLSAAVADKSFGLWIPGLVFGDPETGPVAEFGIAVKSTTE